jgi:endonuclease/exonuclease/phosphatase family metal-dependent hydrolase
VTRIRVSSNPASPTVSISTRRQIQDWSFTRLPLRNMPLGRGLIRAYIDLGDGKSVDVINTHLSAYATSDDRIPQVEKGARSLEWNAALVDCGRHERAP